MPPFSVSENTEQYIQKFNCVNNWFAADENHGTLQTVSVLSGTGGHAGQYWSNNAACKITFSAEL